MIALGVQGDYVDYMMGHTIDTYHDIQSLGIDKLRTVYSVSGLCIRQKTQISKLQTAKEMIRTLGMNPEQLMTKEALAEGATTYRNEEDLENHQLAVLTSHLRQLIHQAATG
jgi:hypothetical protein